MLAATLLVVQQRAALVGLCFAVGLLFARGWRSGSARHSSALGARLTVGLLLTLGVVVFGNIVITATGSGPTSSGGAGSRLADFSDEIRLGRAADAFDYGLRHPLIGGKRVELVRLDVRNLTTLSNIENSSALAAHNAELNALEYYGFPGLVCWLVLMYLMLQAAAELFNDGRTRPDWLLVGLSVSVFSYLIVAQFHNTSPVTGDPLPLILLALAYRHRTIGLYEPSASVVLGQN
jgi:O-antigen ligase